MNPQARCRRYSLFALTGCALGLLLSYPQIADAQKVGSYDYTNAKLADRTRPPLPPPPPKRLPDGTLAVEGVCGGILSNSALVVSIVSLDRNSYTSGDEFAYVLQVKARYTTRIPVGANRAAVEPSDPKANYDWRAMNITLELRSPGHRPIWIGLLGLAGSKEAGSEIELKTGEWIEVRGKARFEWSNPPSGSVSPGDEEWLHPFPLQRSEKFSASALALRGQGYHYDAETRQERRVCYPGEQSYGDAMPLNITIKPKTVP